MLKRQLTSALLVAMLGGFAASASAAGSVSDSTGYQAYQRYLDGGSVKSTATDTTTTRVSSFEAYQRYLGFTDSGRSSADDKVTANYAAASTYRDYERVIGGFSL